MKNNTYYPFIRNRYFNGKLLTAQDFEQEQRYFNDKRRLINRWVLGYGVAAGLEVIQVDDYHISLEMGLAFDQVGREIFVEAPSIRKLSLLEGYEEATMEEGNESLYLYIEYNQAGTEPVHNINNDALHGKGQTENSKYKEGYHLYVTDDEPEPTGEERGFGNERAYIAGRAAQIGQGAWQRGICLAKVNMVKAGSFYMIDTIIQQPFHQYVMNLPLTSGILNELRKGMGELLERQGRLQAVPSEAAPPGGERLPDGWQFADGTARITVPKEAGAGACFYSEEQFHGLGHGNVQILLSVISGDDMITGAPGIFRDSAPGVEAACRLSKKEGVFTIGIRLNAPVLDGVVTVGWTAMRNRDKNEFIKLEPRLFIKPGIVNAAVREEIQLTVVCVNMDQSDVTWRVLQPEGGSVDEYGRYHAPGRPGVYEAEAVSISHPGVKASVFIVVRDA